MMTTLFSNLWREGRTAFVAALVVQMSVLVWLMLAPVPAFAASAASPWVKTEQTELRLIAATETAGAAETLRLGLHFKLKPGWKIYWRSPGDAGFPPIPDWSSSRNLKSAVMQWPAPERFSVLGLETLGYKKEVVFPITVTREDATKPLRLSGVIRYLVCDEICIPYDADVALNVAQGPLRPSPFAHLISRFQSNVPGDGNRHGLTINAAETWKRGKTTMLRVRVTAAEPFRAPDLYPEGPQALTFAKPTVRLGPDGLSATLDLEVFGTQYLKGPEKSLAGRTLTVTLVDGMRSAEARLTVAPALAGSGLPTDAGDVGDTGDTEVGPSLALILAFALLGGLILNLMPCVLPVLSIKLLSVVGHGGGERRLVRLSFLASAAGILFAFLVLAGALIALKAGGMTIGWGIQFQQPWFLIAMTLMVTAFALNLWGLFEVRLPFWISDLGEHTSHVHGLGGHFLQGAFATLLATPCSAPFLGTAVGFALARGWGEITAVFAALGLGLALPYLGVAAFPGLATRLPKPGPWMVTFRRFLGLALIATGVWLLSVLAASAGFKTAVLVGGLTVAAAGLLALARLKRPGVGRRAALGISAAVLAAFLAPGWLGSVAPGTASAKLNSATDVLGKLWQPFDEARIPGLIAQGNTVFVDVTADWCITCQVNKGLVLSRGKVLAKLQDPNVVIMQADWTRPDPVISDFLARHDRFGIPFNAVYGLGAPKGVVLPELLSQSVVLKAFKTTARPPRVSSGTTGNATIQNEGKP